LDQPAGREELATEVTVTVIVVVFARVPDDPLMFTVTVPVAAVLLAVRDKALVDVVLMGLKDAVTPLGRPDADKLTLPLKPFCGATAIVLVPVAPCGSVRVFGDAERVKLGGTAAAIDSDTVVELVRVLEVPEMVMEKVPVAAVLFAASVSVLLPVVLLGLNVAVTPLGNPEALKFTLPLKPFCGVTVIVLVPLPPWFMLTLLGDADSV
jgi:hypothetical protein